MRIDILTLFPEMFEGPLSESILRQAREKGLLTVGLTDIRDFARDKHRTADDYQYGGGSGMVMKPEPIFEALESVLSADGGSSGAGRGEEREADRERQADREHGGGREHDADRERDADRVRGGGREERQPAVILLSARGRLFDQALAAELARRERLILICGRYKGVDERVCGLATHEVSIGDYVLTGGELAAMVVVDAVARFVPGVLGDIGSAETDSFCDGLLGPPSYTRPEVFRDMAVPEVLISGNHERIRLWRRRAALEATRERRPDLLEKTELSEEDLRILREIEDDGGT